MNELNKAIHFLESLFLLFSSKYLINNLNSNDRII